MKPLLINAKQMRKDEIVSLREEVNYIKEKTGSVPKLVIIKATDNKACEAYIRNKVNFGEEVGINVEVIEVPYGTSQDELEDIIVDLGADIEVDGVILQLPVYYYFNKEDLIRKIYSGVDADCFSATNLGEVMQGKGSIAPCTPLGVIDILQYHKVPIEGSRITVIGRSTHVGLTLSSMLTQMGAIVTNTHSKTPSLKEDVERADIVISCVGKMNLIQPEWMKKGSVILGVGINFVNGKQYTDYDVDRMLNESECSLVGDRVGCTGYATVINLVKNTIRLCREGNNI